MAKEATTVTQSFASSGFRMTASPSELEVVRDNRTYDSLTKKKRFAAVFLCLFFACVYYVIEFTRMESSHPISIIWTLPATLNNQPLISKSMIWMELIVLPVFPLLIVWEILYSGTVNLKCTQDSVQITRLVWGKVRRVLSFPKSKVARFEYVEGMKLSSARSSYLRFFAGERMIKCLPGLKCTQAQLILNELERVGFDVLRDSEQPVNDSDEGTGVLQP
jgi:hypothetical protein